MAAAYRNCIWKTPITSLAINPTTPTGIPTVIVMNEASAVVLLQKTPRMNAATIEGVR